MHFSLILSFFSSFHLGFLSINFYPNISLLILNSLFSSRLAGGVFTLLLLLEFLKLFWSLLQLMGLGEVLIGDMGISSIFSRSCAMLADWCLCNFEDTRFEPDAPGRLDEDMSGWYGVFKAKFECCFDESTIEEIVSMFASLCIVKSSLSKLNCLRNRRLEPGFPESINNEFGLTVCDLSPTGIDRLVSLGLKQR